MDHFFKKYKKLRKDQKIDLADIENRTKINIKYLIALEAGNFDLIQKPYTRLFLRAYINEIGADPDESISELTEYLLKKDNTESKETEKTEQGKNTSDKKEEDISTKSDKKLNKSQNISLRPEKMKVNTRTSISPNLIKGILFIIAWVVIIIIIRNITIDNGNNDANTLTTQVIENVTNITSFEQLQTDFIEISSQQTAIEQSLPLIVKIVSNKALGIVSVQDSMEVKSISIAAGDQKTFSFDAYLDVLLHHTSGITIFINGETIRDIRPQETPVRLTFSVEPKSVTIKHYSKTD
ncbi:MAG: helix-turn-helix transcriptional regulator [Candidatus Neomarinimicrobiota bacterium]